MIGKRCISNQKLKLSIIIPYPSPDDIEKKNEKSTMKQGDFGHFHKFILTSSNLLLLVVLISQCITMQAENTICSYNFMLYLLNAAYVSADWFLYDGKVGFYMMVKLVVKRLKMSKVTP